MKKFLTAITTYGTPAYIDLNLSYLQMFNYEDNDIIVVDDCSKNELLENVCNNHRVKLISTSKNHGHYVGDLYLFNEALKHGIENDYEYLLKISRKWICLNSPYESLNWLIEHTDGTTFSNRTITYNFGFRTEFICIKIDSWKKNIEKIENELKTNKEIFVESFIHNLARESEPNTLKYFSYKRAHRFDNEFSGYVRWDWMGDDRINPPSYILWHDKHCSSDYFSYSKDIGLNWTLEDFT